MWAGIIVVLAALAGVFDESTPDNTVPAPVITEYVDTTWASPVATEAATTSTTVARGGSGALGGSGTPIGSSGSSGSRKTPRTTAPPDDEEVDCNNWEDYVDSGEYDIEDIADICGLDEDEIADWENG